MDRGQFDALARFVSTKGSRRTALAAVLGAALLGRDPAAALGKGKKVKAQAKAKAKPCYPGTNCTPGKGKNTSGCDFSNSTIFHTKDARGANLSNSKFTLADLGGADFRGANLSGGCFVDASLLGATLGSSVNLGKAIFCNTVMPDGSINNSGCDRGTACCPTTCQGDSCPPGGCNLLDELCGALAGPCCAGQGTCTGGVFSTCQTSCFANFQCTEAFPTYDVQCTNAICMYKTCNHDSDCPHSNLCCQVVNQCCIDGQVCGENGCTR
jgi:hypothetical protein